LRILVMGSGGTGAYFGAKLVRAGHQVVFVARGAHLEALQTRGLEIAGVEQFHLPQVQATQDPSGMEQPDLILFAVKAYDTEAAAALVGPLVGPETVVLPIQNGVDTHTHIGAVVGHDRVLAGLCRISAEISAPGVIRRNSAFSEIIFGEPDGMPSQRTAHIATTLEAAGISVRISSDIRADLWRKFAFITAMSGVTGATRSPIGPIREVPETFALYRQIAQEVVAVAHSEGVAIESDLPDTLTAQAKAMAPGLKASLLVDLERGRRTEVETLQGNVVRLGAKNGVPTPVTAVIYGLLKLHQPR